MVDIIHFQEKIPYQFNISYHNIFLTRNLNFRNIISILFNKFHTKSDYFWQIKFGLFCNVDRFCSELKAEFYEKGCFWVLTEIFSFLYYKVILSVKQKYEDSTPGEKSDNALLLFRGFYR